MLKISPISDRVAVKRIELDEKMGGSFIMPESALERPNRATVIAVGPGLYDNGHLVPMQVKVGDVVLIGKYSGTEMTIHGEDILIMREAELLAIDNTHS